MPPMPVYYVGKGTQFGVPDMFDGTDRKVYDDALTRLRGPTPLQNLAQNRANAGGLTQQDVDHFKDHWLDKWWKGKHVTEVLRAGIIKALEVALPTSERRLLPVEALWVCANEDVFHIYVNEGPHQVTVIVYTPTPEEYPPQPAVNDEGIWVVKTRDDNDTANVAGPITRLNPAEEWPVLIERRLKHVQRTGP
jgi:hypothetical protein